MTPPPEFLAAYDEHRVGDQIDFYARRVEEYDRSARQLGRLKTLFLALAAACGLVGSFYPDQNTWLGVVAAVLSAFAAALVSWGDVIGFAENSELYRAARAGLARLRPQRPDDRSATDEEIRQYMSDVEAIVLGEVRSWAERRDRGDE